MTMRRVMSLVAVLTCVTWFAACAPKHSASGSSPSPPPQALVALLADTETGRPGRAAVSNEHGSVELGADRESTAVSANSGPAATRILSESEVQSIFGAALSALPPSLRHFTLYFRFDSDELTDESRAQLPEVVNAVRGRAAPEVSIVGHTDTAGVPSANIQLGLRRANAVRNMLVSAGLDPSVVEATSHGESDLLIRTPNETAEQRNRRVEISVR